MEEVSGCSQKYSNLLLVDWPITLRVSFQIGGLCGKQNHELALTYSRLGFPVPSLGIGSLEVSLFQDLFLSLLIS